MRSPWVETEEHVHFLRNAGCDYAQGYYYARPVPPLVIEETFSEAGSV